MVKRSNFFTNLINSGQFIIDEDGHAMLLGEYLVMIPPKAILELSKILEDKFGLEETQRILLRISETQVAEAYKRYTQRLGIDKVGKKEILDFSIKTLNLLGWGSVAVKKASFEDKTFEAVSVNTVLPIRFREKYAEDSENPVDTYLLGVLKKIFESLFEAELEVREEECMAMGDTRCRFVGKPAE